jgi:NAD(P)-dependent dehydrogenase (short-subunit alcohol dehydrogenase family)
VLTLGDTFVPESNERISLGHTDMATAGESTRSVVITGASTGIGEACALHLDGLGWRVFAGVRTIAAGEVLQAKSSARLLPVCIDVTDAASIASAREIVTRELGVHGLTCLVNNAGIVVAAPLEFVPLDDVRRQFEVNVIGAIAATQAFLPLIRKSRGRIVNIGSDNGRLSLPIMGPYCASKFAIEAITDALRIELAPWGIEVVLIEPGNIATPIWRKSLAEARRIEAALPPEYQRLYGSQVASVRAFAAEFGSRGSQPLAVAKMVARALDERRPDTRYPVGLDARVTTTLVRFLPDRLLDRLIRRLLNLPKRVS